MVNLVLYAFYVRTGKVYLVYYGNYGQILFKCHVHVTYSLAFHPLCGVNKKKGPLAGGDCTAYLVAEVHVSRRINKIKLVVVSVLGMIWNGDGLAFYSDAPFPLYVHVVQNLVHHLAVFDDLCLLNQTVGQS